MKPVGTIVDCEWCGGRHPVVGHMGGMDTYACPTIPQGCHGISTDFGPSTGGTNAGAEEPDGGSGD